MKVQDFEMAVEALNCSIVLDEVKIQKKHVRRCYGHKGETLIMWDECGRGYSVALHDVFDEYMEDDEHLYVSDGSYERDKVYDLKFD
jgi:hypothetical protein